MALLSGMAGAPSRGADGPTAPGEVSAAPPRLADLADEIAAAVGENGLGAFASIEYPLYVVQEGSADAIELESAERLPPTIESLRLQAVDLRGLLTGRAALFTFRLQGAQGAVPVMAWARRDTDPAGVEAYMVRAMAIGVPDDCLTQATAEISGLVDGFLESYIGGELRAFSGVSVPLLWLDGTDASLRRLESLPPPPLAPHRASASDLDVMLSGGVGMVSFVMTRDEGPLAVSMLLARVEGRWHIPAVAAGPLDRIVGGPPVIPGDTVLVDGIPPLLGRDADDATAYVGYILNRNLSRTDRERFRAALVRDFAGADEATRHGLLALSEAWRDIASMPWAERSATRRTELQTALDGARTHPELESARALLALFEQSRDVLVAGPMPLTHEAATAYAGLMASITSVLATGDIQAPEPQVRQLMAELVRAYHNMPDTEKERVAQAPVTWARLQALWQTAGDDEREALTEFLALRLRVTAHQASQGGAYLPKDMAQRLGGDEAVRYMERLFPEPAGGAPQRFNFDEAVNRAYDEGRAEVAAALNETRHRITQELIEKMMPPVRKPPTADP